jgi:ubiquinone/menaquinone biosynthesis C-methylase UbiE
VDYDKTRIAATYDAARGYRPEVLRQWLDLVAAHAPSAPALIVDLGCGTGRFTQPLAQRFDAKVVGIDPSERMLAVARAKQDRAHVEFRQASAEKLPLQDGSVDMVFMSMVLHHLPDRPATARECHRILRDKGRLCVRNCTRNIVYPQSRFFPGMRPMDDAELPSSEDVLALFEAAGLRSRAHEIVTHTVAASWQEFADKLALRADSFLARLPDHEFAAGLAALRAYASGRAPEAITEQIDFFVFERGGGRAQ